MQAVVKTLQQPRPSFTFNYFSIFYGVWFQKYDCNCFSIPTLLRKRMGYVDQISYSNITDLSSVKYDSRG